MPRGKRAFEDDPTKSDSADEDFDIREEKRRSSRAPRSAQKPRRKKQKRRHNSDDDDDIIESDESLESEASFSEEQEVEEPEVDPRTGRPMRRTKRNRVQYEESDTNSIDYMNDINDMGGESDEEISKPAPRRSNRRVLVTVKIPPLKRPNSSKSNQSAISRRGGSRAGSRAASASLQPTRKSSRIAHDEPDELYELTRSGHHVAVTGRDRTKSPERLNLRPTRGGKGLKKPTILDIAEESMTHSKQEPEDDDVLDAQRTEIPASREEIGEAEYVAEPDEIDENQDTELAIIPASQDDDEDEEVPTRSRRQTRHTATIEDEDELAQPADARSLRRTLRSAAIQPQAKSRSRRRGVDDTSDFEPMQDEAAEDDVSSSSNSSPSKRKPGQSDSDVAARRSKRIRNSQRNNSGSDESQRHGELQEELEELRGSRPRKNKRKASEELERPARRSRNNPDYRIWNPDLQRLIEDQEMEAATPSKRGKAASNQYHRSLYSVEGPFGGAIGPAPVFPGGHPAVGGADSDSSDDENQLRPRGGIGGMVGMTPTSAAPPGFGAFPAPAAQTHNADSLQTALGKVKDKQALADADPLGVDQNVNFDGVGGLDGHIDQLKEMVALPLLYPEIFQRFKVTPPRGVLFHGPPGTGKTLLARALASSVSSSGRKVTFYMRKGADALSKWVGEAERQLRLLFEEARKNQPSIIFFDEIDGLAPVRSSKQEQIHASIVSTLLALMDGMDGRGQVIVIGATNRPDSVDPALRRPGRFDREFYFPLPNKDARKKILEIHTKDWNPPVAPALKEELAELTKGYGGADLRALCTEAALNAVQRRYPQIYSSNEKLLIKPETIEIAAKDFMISIKKIVPSSERSASSGAAPLPKSVAPLLTDELKEIQKRIAEILPQKKKVSALEEAKFEDATRDDGMQTERLLQEFERSRVFRPRFLIRGTPGMGQQYLVSALLHQFEGLHVQSFDLPSLLSDSTRSPEAAVVQFFTEVKRHKPSVIYIPNVDLWYQTVGSTVISTFTGLLRTLSPSDPVMVLGFLEAPEADVDPQMVRDLFGFSKKNQFPLKQPSREGRKGFFAPIKDYLRTSPSEFPEPANRKPRVLEKLAIAPPEAPKPPKQLTKEELKAQKKRDRYVLNLLKIRLQHIFDFMKKYKQFRNGVVENSAIRYLFLDEEQQEITQDTNAGLQAQVAFRPFEKSVDEHGEPGLRETATGKFYYNLEFNTIEKRIQNGYYIRPKDFLSDIKKLVKDAKAIGDEGRLLRALEIQSNLAVDLVPIEQEFNAECNAIYEREQQKRKSAQTNHTETAIAGPSNTARPEAAPDSSELTNGVSQHDQGGSNDTSHAQQSNDTSHAQQSNGSSLTNGISDLSDIHGLNHRDSLSTNKRSDDANMADSEDTSLNQTLSSFGPSAQTRPGVSAGPSSLADRASRQGGLSQRGLITPLAEGSNSRMYENDASTTSSGENKGSSGQFASPDNNSRMAAAINMQPTAQGFSQFQSSPQRYGDGPGLHELLSRDHGTDLPQTQPSQPSDGESSQQHSSASQREMLAPVKPASLANLLNKDDSSPPSSITLDHSVLDRFIETLVDETASCTVEQLEQVYSGLMAEIWRTRGDWNRSRVVGLVEEVFRDVIGDIVQMQGL